MAKWIINPGMENYTQDLEKLLANSEEMIKRSIYPGAAKVIEAAKREAKALPVQHHVFNKHGLQVGITAIQKQGIIDGLGLAKMRNDGGFINTKLGIDGYNAMKTKKYPGGQPNALIARAIESGTSFRAKNGFISRATRSAKTAAEEAMRKQYDEEVKKVMR